MFGSVDLSWEWREYGRIDRLEADIPQLGKLYVRRATIAQPNMGPGFYCTDLVGF
jgi:hypothetical protein